jgi:hypothetical protein
MVPVGGGGDIIIATGMMTAMGAAGGGGVTTEIAKTIATMIGTVVTGATTMTGAGAKN